MKKWRSSANHTKDTVVMSNEQSWRTTVDVMLNNMKWPRVNIIHFGLSAQNI
jgi:hypothetical protein